MLLKRGKKYHCRLFVPLDLQKFFGRKELKKALGTSDRKEAKAAAIALRHKVETAFLRIRTGMLTDRELEQLSTSIIEEFCGKIDRARRQRKEGYEFLQEFGLVPGFSQTDVGLIDTTLLFPKLLEDSQQVSDTYHKWIQYLEEQRATGNYSESIRNLAESKVKEQKLSVILPPPGYFNQNDNEWFSPPTPSFARVCDAVIEGLINAYALESERVMGRKNAGLEADIAARIAAAKPRPKLSDLWEGYSKDKCTRGKWSAKTALKNQATFYEVVSLIGDRELTAYDNDSALDLLGALKNKGNSATTITGKVEFLSSLFKFALKTPDSIRRWQVSAYSDRIRPAFRRESVHHSGANPATVPLGNRPPFRSISGQYLRV